MKPISDKLSASFPPSTKIVSCSEGHLILNGDNLNQVIKHAQEVSWSLYKDTPVALLSIMGTPSQEKYLLIRSFLEFYAHGKGRIKEKSGKNANNNNAESSTGTGMQDSTGVYLVNKPFYMEVEKHSKLLIWIMFQPGSESGESQDTDEIRLMERFLLLASSRIAEVEFENEEFHGLKQWAELEGLLKTSFSPQQLCLSFIHAVPSSTSKSSSSSRTSLHRLSTTTLSGQKLHLDLDLDPDKGSSVKEKLLWGVNLITMSSNNCQNESIGRFNTQSLSDFHRKIPKLSAKTIQDDGRGLGLDGLYQFMKDCVDSVNDVSDMERSRPRATSITRSPRVSLRPKYKRSIEYGHQPVAIKTNGATSSTMRTDSEMDLASGEPDPPVILRRPLQDSKISQNRPMPKVLTHRSSIPLPPQPLTVMEVSSSDIGNYVNFNQNTIPSPEKESSKGDPSQFDSDMAQLSCRVVAVHKKRPSPEPEANSPKNRPGHYDKNDNLPQEDLDPAVFCEMIDAVYGIPVHQISEEDLAHKLLPKVLTFYNDEMKRFLDDDAYPPTMLDSIHGNLKKLIFDDVSKIFKMTKEQIENLRLELMASLDQEYSQKHRQQNTVNLKRKQEMIRKCLEELMSSYVEQIEEVLQRHPTGLRVCQLKRENDAIIKRLKRKLESETRRNVRVNEPLDEHVKSLMTGVNGYWAGVAERNDQNLRMWNRNVLGQIPQPGNFDENLTNSNQKGEVDDLEKSRQRLSDKIEEITYQLEDEQQFFAFKFQGEEDQLKMKVKRASSFLQKPDCPVEEIQKQVNVLQIWAAENKR